jgi:hypothetical protein
LTFPSPISSVKTSSAADLTSSAPPQATHNAVSLAFSVFQKMEVMVTLEN